MNVVPSGMDGSERISQLAQRLPLTEPGPEQVPEPGLPALAQLQGRSGCRAAAGSLLRGNGAGVFPIFGEDGDHFIDLHAFGASGNEDLCQDAFIDGLDFHRGLVGLDLGNDIAGRDLVAFLLQPFRECALLHRWRQCGHENINGHQKAPELKLYFVLSCAQPLTAPPAETLIRLSVITLLLPRPSGASQAECAGNRPVPLVTRSQPLSGHRSTARSGPAPDFPARSLQPLSRWP